MRKWNITFLDVNQLFSYAEGAAFFFLMAMASVVFMFFHWSHQGARWAILTGPEPAGSNINEERDLLIVASGSETTAPKPIQPDQTEPPSAWFFTRSFIIFWTKILHRDTEFSMKKLFLPLAMSTVTCHLPLMSGKTEWLTKVILSKDGFLILQQ